MLPYQLAFAGFAFPLIFPLRLPFPVFAVFSADLFPDFSEAVLSCLSVVFFAGVVSACDFFFSGVTLGFGEAFLLGLGLGEGFGVGFGGGLGDGVGCGIAAGI